MAPQTVREILGDVPSMDVRWDSLETLDPSKIWASYDDETDSFVLYTTGKPTRGVKVWVADDMYVIVDRTSRNIIGLYVEHWGRSFVPAHKEIQAIWESFKPDPVKETAWITLLRMMALWVVASFAIAPEDYALGLQPA